MRFYHLKLLLALLAAGALLLGSLSIWIYEPACGKSPTQIALSLLAYHNLTATNGMGDLGTEIPGSLMLYHQDWYNCHHSGKDFSEVGYYYHRLGMYFERYFELQRDLPGGHTWTLTCNVQAVFPIFGQRWWTQQLITINDATSSVSLYDGQSNSIPSDAVIGKHLPGTWRMTDYAADNGWNKDITIGTNGDYAATNFFLTEEKGGEEFGRVRVLNGLFIMTVTNLTPDPQFPVAKKLPNLVSRQRIFYADDRNILLSCDLLGRKALLEKKE